MNICSFLQPPWWSRIHKRKFSITWDTGSHGGNGFNWWAAVRYGEQGDRNPRWWNFYLLSMKWCLGTQTQDTPWPRGLSFVLDVQAPRKWLDNPPRVDLLSISSVKHELRQASNPLISSSVSQLWRTVDIRILGGPWSPPTLRNRGNEEFEMSTLNCTELRCIQHLIKLRPGGNKSKEAGNFLQKWQWRGEERWLSSRHNELTTNNHINLHQPALRCQQ